MYFSCLFKSSPENEYQQFKRYSEISSTDLPRSFERLFTYSELPNKRALPNKRTV